VGQHSGISPGASRTNPPLMGGSTFKNSGSTWSRIYTYGESSVTGRMYCLPNNISTATSIDFYRWFALTICRTIFSQLTIMFHADMAVVYNQPSKGKILRLHDWFGSDFCCQLEDTTTASMPFKTSVLSRRSQGKIGVGNARNSSRS
jgi:hypothetical protein